MRQRLTTLWWMRSLGRYFFKTKEENLPHFLDQNENSLLEQWPSCSMQNIMVQCADQFPAISVPFTCKQLHSRRLWQPFLPMSRFWPHSGWSKNHQRHHQMYDCHLWNTSNGETYCGYHHVHFAFLHATQDSQDRQPWASHCLCMLLPYWEHSIVSRSNGAFCQKTPYLLQGYKPCSWHLCIV